MKTYSQLTPAEQSRAQAKATNKLLKIIIEYGAKFDDKNLQDKIDAAFAKAERMQTPWFAHEYIMDTCKDEICRMALDDAKECLYSEPHEVVVSEVIE